ncbi:hypothetical protein M404DRAFT_898166 [Pisolithus tinctorius Marx 270]|uniref:Uncharacterized protein n=1 Tax=Pisolithus tinctorius Marx 270 TaxID=870435 RepID=A0A0C3NPP2_PISTI|nr:hypothetical protein M404DRAFT_898166 [Pisolithus tinctorius Marx 270]
MIHLTDGASRMIRRTLTIHSRTLEFTRRASGGRVWRVTCPPGSRIRHTFQYCQHCQLSRPSLTPKIARLKAPKRFLEWHPNKRGAIPYKSKRLDICSADCSNRHLQGL